MMEELQDRMVKFEDKYIGFSLEKHDSLLNRHYSQTPKTGLSI